jgi:hypothetical protein
MALNTEGLIVLITFILLFGVFLFFDIFKRNERYRYLAYIVALLPVNYLWIVELFGRSSIVYVYIILFILWILCILRDMILVYRKTKEYDDIFAFFIMAAVLQIILSAIIPEVVPALKPSGPPFNNYTVKFWYFYTPDIFDPTLDPDLGLAFRLLVTALGIFIIAPLLLDIKDEALPLPVLVVITAIFILPIILFSFIWIGEGWPVLTLLFTVIFFIALLVITKSGKEAEIKL